MNRRLMSPEGRNHTLLHARVSVAACADGRAFCPAAASSPLEWSHARTRFGNAPVGKEADPAHDPDPPLTYRVPEGNATRPPVPG